MIQDDCNYLFFEQANYFVERRSSMNSSGAGDRGGGLGLDKEMGLA